MKKESHKSNKRSVQKAVSRSSAIEGQSFSRAKKNIPIINLLRKYGRGFSV
ncbi:hypothetical protein KJ742_05375 [Patescibacteria group bacterium]|nr:hypothetical protein [Patescibacteria group bacterium]MBU1683349.1 hypothetical protein [Patescibacteria group bacterium]MBU1935549.1 hypothetical protein [Patescibacteria group bacterium]